MKIVIVGGGTAGWIAALIISSVHKNVHELTLIESSSMGTIGVGESTTGFLRGIVNNEVWDYGCNEIDFIKYTNAVPKLGISYKRWNNNIDYMEPVDGPFGYNDNIWTSQILNEYVYKNIPMHMSSINGRFIEYELSSFFINDEKILNSQRHGYTFDAKLGAEYFKNICKEKIKNIDSKIKNVVLKENGFIEYLEIDNGEKIYGDFFIDASGNSKILSKSLGIRWKDYDEISLNAAMPFLLDHKDKKNIDFISTSIAMKNGWMWMNPKQDVLACGYIYDKRLSDFDESKNEVEYFLGKKINPIKDIEFRAGRLESFWNKNTLSIGLSSSFLEPLEATSIHGTIAQLNRFVFTHLKNTLEETMNPLEIEKYNNDFKKMIDNHKNFVLFHYTNNRTDTDFWKNTNNFANNEDFIKYILEISKHRLLNRFDIDDGYGFATHELFNWVLIGLGHFNNKTAKKTIKNFNNKNIALNEEIGLVNYLQSNQWLTNKDFIKHINNVGV